ncbi:hypothetical protein KFE25_008688 [Diacronema lutheri]|uniref:non-specific serine/threonine protein kinase n=1 Tax=Diacronema lutheri TaxID=2081491 RepID=A0A8J5XXC6_DIALT|nr:hypothetical protein KFE25_008688 [Diacronema lutheri]
MGERRAERHGRLGEAPVSARSSRSSVRQRLGRPSLDPPMPQRAYRTIKQIGRGAQSDVFLVRDVETHSLFVMKRFATAKVPDSAKREVDILRKLRDHPSIVTVHDAFEEDGGVHFCVIVSYCSGGDLAQRIAARIEANERFTDDEILEYAAQLACALDCVHRRAIIHRDLKPENIFIMGDGQLALGDFGVAKELEHGAELAETIVGTPYYLPPETVRGEPYSSKADVWALGVVLYELAQLSKPFVAKSLVALAHTVQHDAHPPLPPSRTVELRRLLQMTLEKDPLRRASAAQLMGVPALHSRLVRARSFAPAQLPRSRRVTAQHQTVVHAAHEGGFDAALAELHKLAGTPGMGSPQPSRHATARDTARPWPRPWPRLWPRPSAGAGRAAGEPPDARRGGRAERLGAGGDAGLNRALWLDELGDVEPAPDVRSKALEGVASALGAPPPSAAVRRSGDLRLGSVASSPSTGFDLRVHQCSCERPRACGTLYITATHVCFVPLLGGRSISIDIFALACVVKARVLTCGCGTGHSLWLAVSALPIADAAADDNAPHAPRSAGRETFHVEKFHGFVDRDQAVEDICQAGAERGYTLPVYAQSGLYKASSARELLRAASTRSSDATSERPVRRPTHGASPSRAFGASAPRRARDDAIAAAPADGGGLFIRATTAPSADSRARARSVRASLVDEFSIRLDRIGRRSDSALVTARTSCDTRENAARRSDTSTSDALGDAPTERGARESLRLVRDVLLRLESDGDGGRGEGRWTDGRATRWSEGPLGSAVAEDDGDSEVDAALAMEHVLRMRVVIPADTLASGVIGLADVSVDAKGEAALGRVPALVRRRTWGDNRRASQLELVPLAPAADGAAEAVEARGCCGARPTAAAAGGTDG